MQQYKQKGKLKKFCLSAHSILPHETTCQRRVRWLAVGGPLTVSLSKEPQDWRAPGVLSAVSFGRGWGRRTGSGKVLSAESSWRKSSNFPAPEDHPSQRPQIRRFNGGAWIRTRDLCESMACQRSLPYHDCGPSLRWGGLLSLGSLPRKAFVTAYGWFWKIIHRFLARSSISLHPPLQNSSKHLFLLILSSSFLSHSAMNPFLLSSPNHFIKTTLVQEPESLCFIYVSMVSWFLTEVPRPFNEERTIFATNGSGTTGWPHSKYWSLPWTSDSHN